MMKRILIIISNILIVFNFSCKNGTAAGKSVTGKPDGIQEVQSKEEAEKEEAAVDLVYDEVEAKNPYILDPQIIGIQSKKSIDYFNNLMSQKLVANGNGRHLNLLNKEAEESLGTALLTFNNKNLGLTPFQRCSYLKGFKYMGKRFSTNGGLYNPVSKKRHVYAKYDNKHYTGVWNGVSLNGSAANLNRYTIEHVRSKITNRQRDMLIEVYGSHTPKIDGDFSKMTFYEYTYTNYKANQNSFVVIDGSFRSIRDQNTIIISGVIALALNFDKVESLIIHFGNKNPDGLAKRGIANGGLVFNQDNDVTSGKFVLEYDGKEKEYIIDSLSKEDRLELQQYHLFQLA